MTTEERIAIIRQARTHEQLDQALAGYRDQLIVIHAELRRHYAFNLALERKQYFHALCDIKRAARGGSATNFQEIIRVLESAADRQFALSGI